MPKILYNHLNFDFDPHINHKEYVIPFLFHSHPNIPYSININF